MIEELKPYESYQATDVPWARRLPSHWTYKRGKAVLAESMLRTSDNQEIVTCFRDGQVTLRRNRRTSGFMIALYEQGYQGVRKGQLVVHAMDAFAGAIGISDSDGKCTPEYVVCDARGPSVHLHYVAHALRVAARDGFILASCPSVRERAPRFRWANLGEFLVPLPPPEEQAAIVRFIEHANRRIDQFIRTKKKLIALLNEQKQAIVHRAVTRGLDPYVKVKDSGVEWIGQVPEQWQVIAIGAGARDIQTGPFGSQLHAHDYIKDGIPIVNPAHMHLGRVREDPTISVSAETAAKLGRHRLEPGDIVVARRGDIGRNALVTEREKGWLCGTGSLVVRVNTATLLPEYFQLAFGSFKSAEALARTSVGTTMANINPSVVARHRLPVPPSLEQQAIVDSVREQQRSTEAAARCLNTELQQIAEYRTRLISDVVTGQLNVRAAAAALPELEPNVVQAPVDDEDADIDDSEAA